MSHAVVGIHERVSDRRKEAMRALRRLAEDAPSSRQLRLEEIDTRQASELSHAIERLQTAIADLHQLIDQTSRSLADRSLAESGRNRLEVGVLADMVMSLVAHYENSEQFDPEFAPHWRSADGRTTIVHTAGGLGLGAILMQDLNGAFGEYVLRHDGKVVFEWKDRIWEDHGSHQSDAEGHVVSGPWVGALLGYHREVGSDWYDRWCHSQPESTEIDASLRLAQIDEVHVAADRQRVESS